MPPLVEYVRSAEAGWLLWLAAVLALACLLRAAVSSKQPGNLRHLLLEEDGAAYTISFVMTFPIYMMFIFIVVETTLFLMVKIGTVHAAYAAARSHIVWSSLEANKAKQKREQAAINVMAAFASSKPKHSATVGNVRAAAAVPNAVKYYLMYKLYDPTTEHAGSERYVMAKYIYAHIATKVEIKEKSKDWDTDIKATVEYEMPFQLSFVGRIIGKRAVPFVNVYTYTVRSSVILPNDAPRNPERKLGIDYVPRD